MPLRPTKDVGELIRTAREIRGLSRRAVSERTTIHEARLLKLENGFTYPREDELSRLAPVLLIPLDAFMTKTRLHAHLDAKRLGHSKVAIDSHIATWRFGSIVRGHAIPTDRERAAIARVLGQPVAAIFEV